MSSETGLSLLMIVVGLALLLWNKPFTDKLIDADLRYGTARQRRQATDRASVRKKRSFAALIAGFFFVLGVISLISNVGT